MFYRLSNTAKRGVIEAKFGIRFKYPRIYKPKHVINGLDEASVPVILNEAPGCIQFSIWGLLPENFRDDWRLFQNSLNTLNITVENLAGNYWYRQGLLSRRCIVIATGFFIMHLCDGELYPYFVYKKKKKPMALAGIYSVLDDGFTTCSLIVGPSNPLVRSIQNLGSGMPIVLNRQQREQWLGDRHGDELLHAIQHDASPLLHAHPIARELLNRDISYDSMLEPVTYGNLPMQQL